jgi:hypothetical protein
MPFSCSYSGSVPRQRGAVASYGSMRCIRVPAAGRPLELADFPDSGVIGPTQSMRLLRAGLPPWGGGFGASLSISPCLFDALAE